MDLFKSEYLSKFNISLDYIKKGNIDNQLIHFINSLMDIKFYNHEEILSAIYIKKSLSVVYCISEKDKLNITKISHVNNIYISYNTKKVSLKDFIDILNENEEILKDLMKQIQE